ncbi:hypothetical protein PAESOLCIP111_05838 [Paenibacillus solanacearum]|uniref:Uncharacterized protein n=1 Tax=Paenibacillus solanacearum TaxID=2048548 RepID=A0A916K8I8_9BACL|nr:hypothetical protein [Paenibacillus solanacearum]CAG7649311.1 hypothetical protein PAESOLCIP111_05838 [Paenibacillus solanacearum]
MNDHVKREWTNEFAIGFPGRWVGGISLIVSPLLLLVGVLIRRQFHFFFPEQLAAVQMHPILMAVSYSCFAAGNLLLCPAVIVLAGLIGRRKPGWAMWGGVFTIFGLFARTFHSGVDHLAFQLVRNQSIELATEVVANSYGAFHIFCTLNLAIMMGWILLAVGAFRSGTLHPLSSVALALMATLPLGVLKGTTPFSMIAITGLCISFIPLGIKILRHGEKPGIGNILIWSIRIILVGGIFFYFGQQG